MDDAIDSKKTKTKKRRVFSFQRLRDSWKWKFLRDFKWKRLNLQIGFFDAIIFRIVSLFEAIALVGIAGFFFLCCGGCRF
uniref:Transmembrane protein n=1 Tax=Cucumis melo TaxID=3656 RepID=A0A9I9CQQ3_CUCME